ncbi:hypothetical protein AB6Q56_10555 [Dechloromonas sp. ARDL1]
MNPSDPRAALARRIALLHLEPVLGGIVFVDSEREQRFRELAP